MTTPRERSTLNVTNTATIPPATSAARDSSSSNATEPSAKSSASASAANASNDVVSGQLGSTLSVADVPLQGPGTWEVATSAPVSVTLTCAGTTLTVETQLQVAAHTVCQVAISDPTPAQNITWELVPSN
ncbi:MAG: hypothetical protein WA580_00875 [Acidimicrobiales bacterium]